MTSSNRILNRLVLVLTGLVLIAAAAWLAAQVPAVARLVPFRVPVVPAELGDGWWLVVIVAGVLLAVALAWTLTRGRGRRRDVHDDAGLRISERVATDIVAGDLAGEHDIQSVTGRAYRRGRGVALLIDVRVTPGARLAHVTDAVRRAVALLDTQLETALPVVLHLTSTSRVISAREHRVD